MRAISIGLAMTVMIPVALGAQHDDHAASLAPASSEAASSICVEAQRRSLGLLEAIDRRVETARQSNSPTELRAAVADLQRGLLEVRIALGRCAELQQALTTAPVQTAPATMPTASGPPAGATPRPARQAMATVQTALDPAKLSCSPTIDPREAAKTTYQGKTYYFCSIKEREAFLADPAMSLSMMPPKQ